MQLKATKFEPLGIVPLITEQLLRPFDFKSMYDLGNKKTGKELYSTYYKNKGIKYTSIDLNGKDGALKLDLRKPIKLPPREMITNLGTSEHILEQKAVFENIHNLSNYRIIHQVPIKGSRPTHGYWGYTIQFFNLLAKLNKYWIRKLVFDNERQIICVSFEKSKIKKKKWLAYFRKNEYNFVWSNELMKYLHRNEKGRGGVTK